MSEHPTQLWECELHGPVGASGYCLACASMERMEPERYNVIGDELRKLNLRMNELTQNFGIYGRQLNMRLGELQESCAQVLVATKLTRMAILRLERKLRKAKRKQ